MKEWLRNLSGTKWKGKGELWLDPEGNSAEHYECELQVQEDSIIYSWIYNQKTENGRFVFDETGATWVDSWHQQNPASCVHAPKAWGIFTVSYEYEVPDHSKWSWRSKLSERPDGSLVLQMTNIAPWGEEGRAARMIFSREQA